MGSSHKNGVSRGSFFQKTAGAAAAASTFTIVKPQLVRGAGKAMLKVGILGVGMRGSQAVLDTWAGNENVQLVAIGELFQDRLNRGIASLKERAPRQFEKKFKVDRDHMFVGFDAYRKVLALDIDVILICTPPAYHPMHFVAAVEAKKHIFCEKPFGTDPVNVRKLMAAAKKAEELKLTVVSGAQRHSHRQYPPQTRHNDVSELVIGTKGRSNLRDMSSARVVDSDFRQGELSPYIQEHIDLVDSILGLRPYINQGVMVAESTLTGIMAREAAYTGMKITWDMIMKSQQDLFPKVLDMNAKIEVPPVPVPGQYKFV